MTRKILLVFSVSLFCMNIVMSQDSLQNKVIPFPKVIFTISPLNQINLRVPATQVGVEYRIAKQLSLQHELGYIYFRNNNQVDNRFKKKKGFRFRNELRYYYNGMDDARQKDYLGFQIRYWNYNSPVTTNFLRGGGQYRQRITYNVQQTAIGGGVSFGTNIITKRKFVWDFGLSGGLILFKNKPKEIPEDAELLFDDGFFFRRNYSTPYQKTQPYLLLTFKFGFAL